MSDEAPSDEGRGDQPGQVDFDLTDWAVESRTMIEQLLVADAIPHVWEAAVLVVPSRFVTLVDGMIDYVEAVESDGSDGSDEGRSEDGEFQDAFAEDADGVFDEDDLDDLDVQALLSDLFVGVDRLRRDARDPQGVLGFVDAVERVESATVPFGFEPEMWSGLVLKLVTLRDAITEDSVDDAAIERSASDLRQTLHALV